MSPETAKAFDFTADLGKQLITLATAIIGLVITFLEKSSESHQLTVAALRMPLLTYIVSIAFGVLFLMALTGALVDNGTSAKPNGGNARIFSALQIVAFLAATVWTICIAS